MSEHDERVEALAKVIAEAWGTDVDLPPECDPYDEAPDYFDDVARHLLDSPAMRDLLAAERATALREAAGVIQDEWGIHYPGEREPRIGPDEQAVREWQTFWNTRRGPGLDEGVVVRRRRVVITTAWEAARIHPADPEETR